MSERQRCKGCGWPLASSPEEGCVPGDCSMRGLSRRPPVDLDGRAAMGGICAECTGASAAFCPHSRVPLGPEEFPAAFDLCSTVEAAQDTWSRTVSTALHRALIQLHEGPGERARLRVHVVDREEKLQSARDTADRHIAESHALRSRLADMQREVEVLYIEMGRLVAAADAVNALWYGKNPAVTPGGWLPALEGLARARGLGGAHDDKDGS